MLRRSGYSLSTVVGGTVRARPANAAAGAASSAGYGDNAKVGHRPIMDRSTVQPPIAGASSSTAASEAKVNTTPLKGKPIDLTEEAAVKKQKLSIFVRLHAKYLGVDPHVLTRYGDGSHFSRYLHFLYGAFIFVIVGVHLYGLNNESENKAKSMRYIEENRKRFYGHDFDQPMAETLRNFQKGQDKHKADMQLIVAKDERTGLMETADSRTIAPARYERDARPPAEITNSMMDRVSQLSQLQAGYRPSTTTARGDDDKRAPARIQ